MLSYCAYQDCTSKNLPFSTLTFFTLPKDHRRQIWIENSGNPQLKNITPTAVRSFCEKHFDPIYLKRQFHRTTLHKSAIPYNYKDITKINNDKRQQQQQEQMPKHSIKSKKNIVESSNTAEKEDEDNSYMETSQRNNTEESPSILSKLSDEIVSLIDDEQNYLENEVEDDDDDDVYTYDQIEYIMTSSYQEETTEKDSDFNEYPEEIKTKEQEELNYECDTNVDNDDNDQQQEIQIIEQNELKTFLKKPIKHKLDSDEVKSNNAKYKKKINEMDKNSINVPTHSHSSSDLSDEKHDNVSSSSLDYEEDKHFALSLVGYFQRLSLKKKSMAKIKILQYLTELQYNEKADL